MTFTGKANKTEKDPSKTLLYMTFTEKTDETENEFLCSNLRLHNLISSKVQNSVSISKGVDFKSGTFSQREGNLPISVAVAIKNHSLCKNRKFTGVDFKRIREPPYTFKTDFFNSLSPSCCYVRGPFQRCRFHLRLTCRITTGPRRNLCRKHT